MLRTVSMLGASCDKPTQDKHECRCQLLVGNKDRGNVDLVCGGGKMDVTTMDNCESDELIMEKKLNR
jgi:hypothetical protein